MLESVGNSILHDPPSQSQLQTFFLQYQDTHLSRPRRIPAEFSPRENTESQHLLWKSNSSSFNTLNMQFIFPKPPPSPSTARLKAGNKEFLNVASTAGPKMPKFLRNAMQKKKKNRRLRCARYVHPSGDEEYRKTKQNHQQPFV